MFDEFTTSNAESEHASLKRKSLGVRANASMTTLAKKTTMNSLQKSNQRVVYESNDIESMSTTTQCYMSQYLVKQCFLKVKDRIELAKKCISKQINSSEWIVFYRRSESMKKDLHLHYIPVIQRLRYVTLTKDKFLKCSCKTTQRYGYPCHHIFHVLKCYDTKSIKKEWIHIRWSKEYALNHFKKSTSKNIMTIYQSLYDNYPIGPHYINTETSSYPIYSSYIHYDNIQAMFPSTKFHFLSKKNNLSWINTFKSNDPSLNRLIQNKNSSFVRTEIHLSQEQQEMNDLWNVDDDDSDDSDDITNINHPVFTDKLAMFKRANDLCGNDVESHKGLYTLLSNFVLTREINHNDNQKILKKRKNDIVTISSNKVINTQKRSTKRYKSSYEK